ncbi:MAG: NAD-dependent epimerase/dehydratase family protein [Sumerlaeia bacterium]
MTADLKLAFVTGGTGFVGGHLCNRLRETGFTVRALARRGSRRGALEALGCELVEGDLSDEEALRRGAQGASVVLHVAGLTKTARPDAFLEVNGEGTKNVLIAAQEAGFTGRFVLLSSLAAAGPARDEATPRTAADPLRPVSDYGRSKRLGEQYAEHARSAFPVTILRPGAIYGPGERDIYEMIKPVAKTGLSVEAGPPIRVQMTHVEDVVEALLVAAQRPEAANQTYFVNDTQAWTVAEIMDLVGEILERKVRHVRLPLAAGRGLAAVLDGVGKLRGKPVSPLTRDKMREVAGGSWIADSTPFAQECGWRAKWALPDGLRQTLRWYRAEGWL